MPITLAGCLWVRQPADYVVWYPKAPRKQSIGVRKSMGGRMMMTKHSAVIRMAAVDGHHRRGDRAVSEMDVAARSWMVNNLWASYAHRIDDGDAASWANLFDESAVLRLPSRTYLGRNQIYEYARQREAAAGRHLVTNIETTFVPHDNTRANVIADFMFVSVTEPAPKVSSIGQYRSSLLWCGTHWLIIDHLGELA